MRRSLPIIASLLLFAASIFIVNAILQVKLIELKVQLTKSQIMNYEFSSEILKRKFRLMLAGREDLKSEIETTALESSIMNFESSGKKTHMTPLQNVGLAIINIVRYLTLKDIVYLADDQKKLVKLQYAFLMERNQRCGKASEKYSELEDELLTSSKDDRAFVLLHHGYCKAITGDVIMASEKLNEVIRKYPGTHFSTSSKILLEVLKESENRTKKLITEGISEEQMAVRLFRSGQHALALKKFNSIENLTLDMRYMKARSNEKVGNIKIAIPEYKELSSQATNLDVAKNANRRLLMLGHLYGGGEEVKKIAETNAQKLGDTEVASNIKEGAKKQITSIIVEKIKKGEGDIPEELKEIKEEIATEMPAIINIKPEIKEEPRVEEVVAVKKPLIKKPVVPVVIPEEKVPEKEEITQKIIVILTDGRTLTGDRLEHVNYSMGIWMGEIKMSIPSIMVSKIQLKEKKPLMKVKYSTKTIKSVTRLDFQEENVKITSGEGTKKADLEEIRSIALEK